MSKSLLLGLLSLPLLGLTTGCQVHRAVAYPTLSIQTSGGRELGVSTEYGVVFLGQTAGSGDAMITAWYGDGPSLEASVIEPIGGGVYTAETEIRLPSVPLTFIAPEKGQSVLVSGRSSSGRLWEAWTSVQTDPRVRGILLRPTGSVTNRRDQVGAGVYIVPDGKKYKRKLLGLVSGRLRLVDEDGEEREFLTVVGPEDLWRLVAHRRDLDEPRRWIYREDIL